jgi:signal transduction histidine kinase
MSISSLFKLPAKKDLQILEQENSQLKLQLQESLKHLDQAKLLVEAETSKTAITLESIVDTVITLDLHSNILMFNRAAEKLTEFKAKEAIGKPIDQILKIYDKQHQEVTPAVYCQIKPNSPGGLSYSASNLTLESQAVHPGSYINKPKFVNITVGQIKDGANFNLGCIVTIDDVTQEKELADMQMDFVSMAAHELRTPLTSIKGYLSVFMDENKAKFSEDQMMFLQRISNSVQHLASLIENLLSVSRIERGSMSVNLESIDWVTMARQITEDLKIRAKEKNISLEFVEPTQQIPNIKADKLRINEVLTNLIANAINYTPTQGKVSVWIDQKDKNVLTHIQDTGPGIAPELQHHLFNKFYRVGTSLTQGTKGTGLGLYISKAIVDMLKGQIWVESELGKGSTFSFSIPIYEDSTAKFPFALDLVSKT